MEEVPVQGLDATPGATPGVSCMEEALLWGLAATPAICCVGEAFLTLVIPAQTWYGAWSSIYPPGSSWRTGRPGRTPLLVGLGGASPVLPRLEFSDSRPAESLIWPPGQFLATLYRSPLGSCSSLPGLTLTCSWQPGPSSTSLS